MSTPPIPARNPLRSARYAGRQQGSLQSSSGDYIRAPMSPTSQTIVEEINRELRDTRERLVSALYPDDGESSIFPVDEDFSERVRGTVEKRSCEKTELGDDRDAKSEENWISSEGTCSGTTDGLKRYSAYHGMGSRRAPEREDEVLMKQKEIDHAMASMQRDLDSSEMGDQNGASAPKRNTVEEIGARTVAWLDCGVTVAPSSRIDSSGSTSTDAHMKSYTHPAHTLSLYPPTSPTTGRREYTYPLSPLNNGRDVYGNHIPTNTREYFTAQTPPTSPSSRPRAINKQDQEQEPHLRGGGGWWNNMQAGIGRGGKAQEQPPPSVHDAKGKDPAAVGHDVRPNDEQHAWTQPQSSSYSFEGHYSSKEHQSILDRRQGRSQNPILATASRPVAHNDFHGATNVRARNGPDPLLIHPALRPAPARNTLENLWEHTNQPITFTRNGSTGLEPPLSEASTSPRLEKKWNRGPTTGPPGGRAPLPPAEDVRYPRFAATKIPIPIFRYVHNPQDAHPVSNDPRKTQESIDSFPATPSVLESPSRRAPSPVNTIDDDRWDLQSLQVGESVSVAGRYRPEYYTTPRPTRLWPTARRPGNEPTRDEIEAWVANANAKFRSRAQEINTPYNAEVVRLQRAQQLGQISHEHYVRQSRQVEENKKQELCQAAQETGYAILEDEQAIIEAIKAGDKHCSYNDMLNDPTPGSMPRIEEQVPNLPVAPQSEKSDQTKPRDYSFDSGRKIAGKMLRFILAAPSDPELKTFSSSNPSNTTQGAAPVRVYTSMDGNGLNGLALAQNLDGLSALFRKKSKKNKGKGRAAVDTRGLASSGAGTTKLTGTTAVNSNGIWTGTIDRNAITDQPRGAIIQGPLPRDVPVATSLDVVTRQPTSYAPSNISNVTHQTRWGEVDSHGHVYLPHERERQAGMRGGGSEKVKSEKERKAKNSEDAKLRANRAMAMHFLG